MPNKKLEKKVASLLTPLRFYALNNETTVEDIAKATGKNYSTILRATKKLERLRLVKLNRLERTAAKGKEKRFYALTLYGLEAYLTSDKAAISDIRKIAKAHSDKLLVFKKWPKFIENACERDIILNLEDALKHSVYARYLIIPLIFEGKTLTPEVEDKQRWAFDANILGFLYMTKPPEHIKEVLGERWPGLKRISKVVENDYELRQAREEFLHYLEVQHSEALKSITEWRNYLKEGVES